MSSQHPPGIPRRGFTSEPRRRNLESVEVMAGRLSQSHRYVLNGRPAPRLDAIKDAIYPVKLVDKFGMAYRIGFLDQLVADHGQTSVHRIRVAILSEVVAKIVDDGGYAGVLFGG